MNDKVEIIDWLKNIFLYNPEEPLLFTRLYFWVFFAIVIGLYSFFYKSKKKTIRSAYVFLISLFFYYKSSGLFFFILIFSTLVDFFIGKAVYKSKSNTKSKLLIALSIFSNLGLLIYFKYAYFFTDSFNQMFHSNYEVINHLALWTNEGFGTHFEVDKILLPVGISFYTFQTISYSIDIFRKEVKPVKNLLDFGFYVSFFPQLVAGPIVRAKQFIPQIYKEYSLSKKEFGLALFWILKGLVKKVYIGDYIAVNFVDRVFGDPMHYTGFENLMAMIGYSLQVYVDFSGYTDMAIGIALLMGFTLPTNFNSPYKAMNVAGFWKRWHISLSSWLRDYLYIPMGGNRSGSLFSYIMLSISLLFITLLSGVWWLIIVFAIVAAIFVIIARKIPSFKNAVNTNINLMLTMLIGGLWHGASWQFVIWGGLNGIGLVVYKFWKKHKISRFVFLSLINITLLILFLSSVITQHLLFVLLALLNIYWLISYILSLTVKSGKRNIAEAVLSIALTFGFITFTRVFFRGQSMPLVHDMLYQISHNFDLSLIPKIIISYKWVFSVMLIGFVFHWLPYKTKDAYRNWFISLPYWAQAIISAIVVFIVYQSVSADMQSFIYFQF